MSQQFFILVNLDLINLITVSQYSLFEQSFIGNLQQVYILLFYKHWFDIGGGLCPGMVSGLWGSSPWMWTQRSSDAAFILKSEDSLTPMKPGVESWGSLSCGLLLSSKVLWFTPHWQALRIWNLGLSKKFQSCSCQ